jgi:AraC-like DNA-binding protein
VTALSVPPSLRHGVASAHGEARIAPSEVPMTWLPRCRSQLVVFVAPDGAVKANVAGPSTVAKYKFYAPGPFYVQVAFHADVARAVFGVPVCELADRVVDLHDVWRRDAHEMIERVATRQDDPQAAMLAIERVLATRVRAGARAASLARHATEMLATSANVARLADDLGASERSLRQAFLDHVGISPKRYARIGRLRRVVADAGRASWAQLAAEHGFYDQAHLNAEFRALLRVSPSQYLANELPFVRGA